MLPDMRRYAEIARLTQSIADAKREVCVTFNSQAEVRTNPTDVTRVDYDRNGMPTEDLDKHLTIIGRDDPQKMRDKIYAFVSANESRLREGQFVHVVPLGVGPDATRGVGISSFADQPTPQPRMTRRLPSNEPTPDEPPKSARRTISNDDDIMNAILEGARSAEQDAKKRLPRTPEAPEFPGVPKPPRTDVVPTFELS